MQGQGILSTFCLALSLPHCEPPNPFAMNIQEVIKTLNQMQADGVVLQYAIGGAVGATFYLEPAATLDVDVFIALTPEAGKSLVSLQPILDYLKARGAAMEG